MLQLTMMFSLTRPAERILVGFDMWPKIHIFLEFLTHGLNSATATSLGMLCFRTQCGSMLSLWANTSPAYHVAPGQWVHYVGSFLCMHVPLCVCVFVCVHMCVAKQVRLAEEIDSPRHSSVSASPVLELRACPNTHPFSLWVLGIEILL